MEEPTLYDEVGGMPFFEALVARFYAGVRAAAALLALYPDPADLDGAERRLRLFLVQYWGGPATYAGERGHPRLRMRHLPYPIGIEARDRWLRHMRAAIDGSAAPDRARERLHAYMTMAADAMRNLAEEAPPAG